ncbi:MAG: hypothetical protein JSU68_02575, partial [Phycisphaerales bacterium]
MPCTRFTPALGILGALTVAGCAPPTFVRTSESDWRTVEFRPDLSRDDAWYHIADVVSLKHDIEIMDKDSG